ncbi:MAG: hydroxymethylbilane synthase [Crocinitomicaceae bacterium]|nr:hydroxymethylbilane synthase [Crocinitomicaceae bacterium]
MRKIVIGSRGSDLALWQANHVRKQLEALGHEVVINIIVTQGDAIQHLSFDKLEGKGFFTKEIELHLLDGRIDLAVHSHKDLETTPPAGLMIAAVSEREDPSELLLIRKTKVDATQDWQLIENGIIGTSSARRKSQVIRFRPDLEIKDLRGNVPTRIQKLRDEQYDAIFLAKAGVDRLEIDLSEFHQVVLDPTVVVPAPAQGVLALQIRENDQEMFAIMQNLNHPEVASKIAVERKVLNLMEGGCQLPLGVYSPEDGKVYVSHANNWEDGADWMLYEFDELENMAELIIEDINSDDDDDDLEEEA